ncbi:unnamed protein product, partial [Oppiella nova]
MNPLVTYRMTYNQRDRSGRQTGLYPPQTTQTIAKRVHSITPEGDRNKRPKGDTNNNITSNGSNGFLRSMTSVPNSMTSMSTSGHHLVASKDISKDIAIDEDDDWGNPLIDEILSQAAEQYVESQSHKPVDTQHLYVKNGRPSETQTTQFIRPAPQTMSIDGNDDNRMITDRSNSDSSVISDAIEGRIRILESKNKMLTQDVQKFKTQVIQSQKKIHDVREEFTQQIGDNELKHESEVLFLKNELFYNQQMVTNLMSIIESKPFADGSKVESVKSFMQKRINCQTFSQLKRQEFFGGLASQAVAPTQPMSGSVVCSTPDRMSTFKIPSDNRIRSRDSMPTEIPATPSPYRTTSMRSSQTSQPMQMDTNSAEDIKPVIAIASENQFEPLRQALETKFMANKDDLTGYFIDQQIGLFSDDWIRSPQEINDWCQQSLT